MGKSRFSEFLEDLYHQIQEAELIAGNLPNNKHKEKILKAVRKKFD